MEDQVDLVEVGTEAVLKMDTEEEEDVEEVTKCINNVFLTLWNYMYQRLCRVGQIGHIGKRICRVGEL